MSDILTSDYGIDYCYRCGVTLHTCEQPECEDDDEMFIMPTEIGEFPCCMPCFGKLIQKPKGKQRQL